MPETCTVCGAEIVGNNILTFTDEYGVILWILCPTCNARGTLWAAKQSYDEMVKGSLERELANQRIELEEYKALAIKLNPKSWEVPKEE